MTREEEIFGQALPLGPAARRALLDAACGSDQTLRARLEELLHAHLASEKFLAGPGFAPPAPGPAENPGDSIGRYTLVRPIGEGGCGIVYLAEQTEPVRRQVALKIIKLGMDTRQVIARFEAERQALALMDHPDIARVFDAGTTPTGRPYFVMEYVDGVPITKFCDAHSLSVPARLELFVRVCLALQHAHQKGIIHRDIKPSNILVALQDEVASPKVIDFGIAKATQGRLTEATLLTGTDQLIGTPAYMSPEQAELRDLDIDTRSDVYSLGVLLYELLAGRPPFDPKSLVRAGMEEVRRIIREVEPPRPSTVVSTLSGAERDTIAHRRRSVPARLTSVLRGDLDWIVLRCLEKDRTRRYGTAHELAADVRRHLRSEPVAACPPSALYRVRKFTARHRAASAAIAGVAASLILGTVVSVRQAIRATRAEHEQSGLRAHAERLNVAATAARDHAEALRRAAEAQELAALRLAYASDMNAVQRALELNSLGRARELLDRQRPKPGAPDLRGWEWRFLWQHCRSDARAVVREPDPVEVRSVALSFDAQWAAVGLRGGGQFLLRRLATGEEIRPPPTGSGFVRVEFSPTQPLLAIAVIDQSPARTSAQGDFIAAGAPRILLWDLDTRQVVRELLLNGPCVGHAFSADGRTLVVSEGVVTGSQNSGYLSVWRVADGTRLARWSSGRAWFNTAGLGFAITRDASLAANVSLDNDRAGVIDLRTGRELWRAIACPTGNQVSAMAFSPDGRVLATGAAYADSDIQLWDAQTGQSLGRLQGHRGWVSGLIFPADGKHLLSSSGDQTIRLWDLETRTASRVFRGHKTELIALAFAPDQRTLLSGCKDGSAYLWDLLADRGATAAGTFSPTLPVAFAFADPDGASIVTADRDSRIVQRRGRSYREETVLLDFSSKAGQFVETVEPVVAPLFAPTRPLVAAVIRDARSVQVWDWERRALVQEWKLAPGAFLQVARYPLHFTHSGTRLLVGSAPGTPFELRELDLATGRELRVLTAPATVARFGVAPYGTLLSPDESTFIDVLSGDRESARFDLTAGRVTTHNFNVPQRGTYPGWSPDGRLLAVPSKVGHVTLFDSVTCQPVATIGGFMYAAHSAGFSPDQRRLAIGSTGPEAMTLWDTHNYERVLTLPAPVSVMEPAVFSRDGNVLAGARHFWRAPSWAEIEKTEAAERAAQAAPKP
jgi:WD40 repeat protein